MPNNGNKTTRNHRTRTRNNNNMRRTRRQAPRYVSRAPERMSSQNIMVKTLAQMNIEVTQGSKFQGAFGINPYQFIQGSAWAPYLNVWARYRVEQYDAKVYFPVMNDAYNPGSMAAYLYRDGVASDNPLRTYEQLVVEPGSVDTRIGKHITFHWRPVEPSDRDWYETAQKGTDYPGFGAFGTICAAGLFDDMTNRPEADFQLLVLVTMKIKFATLIKPPSGPYNPDSFGFEDLEVRSQASMPRTTAPMAINRRFGRA